MTYSAMFLQPELTGSSWPDTELWCEPQFALPFWRLWLDSCSQYCLQNPHLVLRHSLSENEGAICLREKGNLSIALTACLHEKKFYGKYPQCRQGHKFKFSSPFLPTNTFETKYQHTLRVMWGCGLLNLQSKFEQNVPSRVAGVTYLITGGSKFSPWQNCPHPTQNHKCNVYAHLSGCSAEVSTVYEGPEKNVCPVCTKSQK